MKTKLLAMLLLAGGSLFAGTNWSIGIGVGVGAPYYAPAPPPPPPPAAYMPPCPGPGYVWVPGYYYPAGPRYTWRAGYWSQPPYGGAYWVTPRYSGHRYYPGYWGGGPKHYDHGKHRGWYR